MNKPKKICFVTGTRADYGIQSRLMQRLAHTPGVDLQIIATNMHLSDDYGHTIDEIVADGLTVNYQVKMDL